MLARHRRMFAIVAFLVLAAPLVVGLVAPDSPSTVLKEGRFLAPAPWLPVTEAGWLALPKQVDAYLRDHFGLRQALITAHRELTKPMLGFGNYNVLVGRNGRLFYLGEDTVRQSAGLVLRDERVSQASALLARMNAALAARGIKFLVAIPPNASTIYQDDLPLWAQRRGRRTEYDLLLEQLRAKGVRAIDLRPVEMEARAKGPAYYLHDTHWTAWGALAGFNAIVEADGRPDWRLDPKSALAKPTPHEDGDLARMLGVEGLTETAQDLALPYPRTELLSANPFSDYVATSSRPGPTIMVFGDSFTGGYVDRMLLPHAGRVVWLEHRKCAFDWRMIDRFHPDEVWWMPNERFLICDPGAKPAGFAG